MAPRFPPPRSMVGASAVAQSTPSRALVGLLSLKERQRYGLGAKVPVIKADDLNSIPSTQMAEGENDSHRVSSDGYVCAVLRAHANTQ